jgi:hypothetical protein
VSATHPTTAAAADRQPPAAAALTDTPAAAILDALPALPDRWREVLAAGGEVAGYFDLEELGCHLLEQAGRY